jgi:Cytosolic domain of 10TM putative phosphate transporter
MNRFTLLNITASEGKFDFVYVFTLLVVSGLAYAVVIL